jgi:hypothetical protein
MTYLAGGFYFSGARILALAPYGGDLALAEDLFPPKGLFLALKRTWVYFTGIKKLPL